MILVALGHHPSVRRIALYRLLGISMLAHILVLFLYRVVFLFESLVGCGQHISIHFLQNYFGSGSEMIPTPLSCLSTTEYITVYSSDSNYPAPFHLTALIPKIFIFVLLISCLTLSNSIQAESLHSTLLLFLICCYD